MDYRREARRMGRPPVPIIDAHAHINGTRAAEIWLEAAEAFGVERVFTQTMSHEAAGVRERLGDRATFVAIPDYQKPDKLYEFTDGYIEKLKWWHGEFGARMFKLWNAPRLRDFMREAGASGAEIEDLCHFDGASRQRVCEAAQDLGMTMMVHVADPDTWFQTKYADAEVYGTKRDQYTGLEVMLTKYADRPWLGSHMAGTPEDLPFLDELLIRHPNLVIDTSATKWQVRELSKVPTGVFQAFFGKWQGRILFGSDIVTSDVHLKPSSDEKVFGSQLASSEAEAFDLYASRYWALRTMFETDYDGESNIADPDLMMVDPEKYDDMSGPRLKGHGLSRDMLEPVYQEACLKSLDRWYRRG
ncbi:MAG: hypothetical protein AAF108_00645 [Planctomycetota bacterium]